MHIISAGFSFSIGHDMAHNHKPVVARTVNLQIVNGGCDIEVHPVFAEPFTAYFLKKSFESVGKKERRRLN